MINGDFNTPIPFKNFDSIAWQRNWGEPVWMGRERIVTEQDVRDYLDRTSKLVVIEEKKPYGWDRYCAILHKTFNGEVVPIFQLAQSILTSSPGTNVTATSDATWNNTNNSVECIGGGGAGGASQSGTPKGAGGGAGAYSKITNYTFATPGTTQYLRNVGSGGAGVFAALAGNGGSATGNVGGSTWFGPTSQTTDPGLGTDNTKCSGSGGSGGGATNSATLTAAGGAGGPTSTSWGQTKYAGGAGGSIGAINHIAGCGGGAPGITGTGGSGVSSTGIQQGTNGGAATGDSGGTAGAGATFTTGTNVVGNPGGTGTFWSTAGAGGGGGGVWANINSTATGGAGGSYGAGGGGGTNTNTGLSKRAGSGAGAQGVVVLTWTPAVTAKGFYFNSPMLGM